jgi:predicted dehydrogenase
MATPNDAAGKDLSRRQFLNRTSVAVAGAVTAAEIPFVHAAPAGGTQVRIGLIGCGGRGTGALLNALGAATNVIYPLKGYHTEDAAKGAKAARKDIKVVALADLFEDRLVRCAKQAETVGQPVPKELCFTGFDAYRKLLAVPDVNYVILATPPHFRPMQLKAAVEAGKNVFMEKPAAVDVPGVRMVMEAGRLAAQKGVGIAAGTQRRHEFDYRETVKRIRDGALGEIVYGRCYWNGGEIWVVKRKPGWSDMEWQLRNWNYFTWLSGDHIVEQHVHNLDIMNWALGAHPVRTVAAVGGRQVRTSEHHGYIFDHFAVEFEYPNGVRMFSQCRQINRCDGKVEEAVVGTKGYSDCKSFIRTKAGGGWRYQGKKTNPYQQEHEDLIASVRAGKPINEAQSIAESTMAGIMGRETAYSGKAMTWEAAMKSDKRLGPDTYELGPYPVQPVAMPGKYKFL